MLLELPGYTLTARSYEGSETVLYRGRRDADSAPVAVKVTRNEYPTSKELARLRREFAILQDLGDLPGVVHAPALEKCGRGVALVMEDLGASSLHDLQQARSGHPTLKGYDASEIPNKDTTDLLEQLNIDDATIWVFRCSGPNRIWALREGNVFALLFWDPEHEGWPSKKK